MSPAHRASGIGVLAAAIALTGTSAGILLFCLLPHRTSGDASVWHLASIGLILVSWVLATLVAVCRTRQG
jgi:uncharacterized membrane protein